MLLRLTNQYLTPVYSRRYSVSLDDCRWWLGAAGSRTPLHVDQADATIIINLSGRKRVVMYVQVLRY